MKSFKNYEPKKGEIYDLSLPTFRVVGKYIRNSFIADIRNIHAIDKNDASNKAFFRYKASARYVLRE